MRRWVNNAAAPLGATTVAALLAVPCGGLAAAALCGQLLLNEFCAYGTQLAACLQLLAGQGRRWGRCGQGREGGRGHGAGFGVLASQKALHGGTMSPVSPCGTLPSAARWPAASRLAPPRGRGRTAQTWGCPGLARGGEEGGRAGERTRVGQGRQAGRQSGWQSGWRAVHSEAEHRGTPAHQTARKWCAQPR